MRPSGAGVTRARFKHSTVWLLIAAVLLLRAAVPQGFMPETADDGTIALVVCGSGGVVHIPLKDGVPAKRSAPSHCAFAGIGAADLPPPLVLPAAVWSAPEYVQDNEAAQRTASLYPRPPSRAPPIRA